MTATKAALSSIGIVLVLTVLLAISLTIYGAACAPPIDKTATISTITEKIKINEHLKLLTIKAGGTTTLKYCFVLVDSSESVVKGFSCTD